MTKEEIISSIERDENNYFSYSHFHHLNMADYILMSSTISDLCSVYPINEFEALEIVEALTH